MVELNPKSSKDIENLILKHGIEVDEFDYKSYWDSTLTYKENKAVIETYLHKFGTKVVDKTEQQVKDEIEELNRKQMEEAEQRAKLQLEKDLEVIKATENPSLDKHFAVLTEFVETLIEARTVYGLILEGEPALGKSYNVVRTLEKKKASWVMLNTHISPMEMYEFFYRNLDKIIVLDDISNLFEDELKVNILMSALWSATKSRIMNWETSSSKLTAPSSFEFKGKVIILTNYIPSKLDTLKSRCFHLELNFSYEDKLKMLYEMAKVWSIPADIVDFIKESSSPATILNFRTLFKISELHNTQETNWKDLATIELKANPDKVIFYEELKSGKPVKDQVANFIAKTGRSRATFYNWRSKCLIDSDIRG